MMFFVVSPYQKTFRDSQAADTAGDTRARCRGAVKGWEKPAGETLA